MFFKQIFLSVEISGRRDSHITRKEEERRMNTAISNKPQPMRENEEKKKISQQYLSYRVFLSLVSRIRNIPKEKLKLSLVVELQSCENSN